MRPDGLTLVPWKEGKCLAWDVTVADTFVAIRRSRRLVTRGRCISLYDKITRTHLFSPTACGRDHGPC